MSKRFKVVLIGAGSSVFTQGLVADFILSEGLGPIELGLVDIQSETLDAISVVVRKMVEEKHADITVQSSIDRRTVLPGADVVVTTIAVGGRRGWEQDVFIPRKYGIYQPVGDTTMPGGISRALRMIPAMLAIAKDVQELCPQALFINYSNPMTAICTAVRKACGVPVIGLCHGVTHVEHYLAKFLGIDPERVTSFGAGLNHLTFLYDIRVDGKDALPQVNDTLQAQKSRLPEGFHSPAFGWNGPESEEVLYCDEPFSWHFYERFGAFPAVLDRHVTEFFPERFGSGSYYGKTLGVDAFSIERIISMGDDGYDNLLQLAVGTRAPDEHLFQRSSGEHEKLVEILQCLANDQRKTFYVNLPNEGAIRNLPANAVLELPAVATARGFYALQITDFPEILASIIRKRLTVIDLTVEAALTGNRELVVEALLADGAVQSEAMARGLATELLEAHRPHLPQFYGSDWCRNS